MNIIGKWERQKSAVSFPANLYLIHVNYLKIIWRLISGLAFTALIRRKGRGFLASHWRSCLVLWAGRGLPFCLKSCVYAVCLVNKECTVLSFIIVE